jgi:hypothetical protein
MVTSRRISTEEDRYGASVATRRSGGRVQFEDMSETEHSPAEYPDGFHPERFHPEGLHPEGYAPERYFPERTSEERARRYADEDLMPTIRTMETIRKRAPVRGRVKEGTSSRTGEQAGTEKEEGSKRKLAFSTKLMIGVYAVILVLAVVLIIATAVASSRRADNVAELTGQLAGYEAELAAQESEISGYLNMDGGNPALADYRDANLADAPSIALKPLQEEQTYEGGTNWFDKLCRFLSGG